MNRDDRGERDEPGATDSTIAPERMPRTEGDVTRPAPIQVALVLLVVLLGLLALWWLWPLLTGG